MSRSRLLKGECHAKTRSRIIADPAPALSEVPNPNDGDVRLGRTERL
jgi:hypothetical protein